MTAKQKNAFADKKMLGRAVKDSFIKLSPKTQAKNPVMFLVFVSAILTSVLWAVSLLGLKDAPSGYTLAIVVILWFTVLFANFAEAIAEGKGKAQADSLRASRKDVDAHRIPSTEQKSNITVIPSAMLKKGELVIVKAGESFLDKMIAMVEGAARKKAPNEIALQIFLVALLVCLAPTTIGALLSAIGIAGMSRLNQANVLAMSGRAIEAAGDVDVLMLDKTGTITLGNRQAAEYIPVDGADIKELADAAQLSSLADETPEGRSVVILAKEQFGIRGVIYLKDIIKQGVKEKFADLRKMGIKTIMIAGDNPITAAAIAAEAGVDDFLAEATPEGKLSMIRDFQSKGHLVAMTGDGTNNAPALAQADVAVAMNSGTQAAKEAGNMVDLDSSPTKLIEIVRIGKQLLMTRGSLTTFSIANDVAKYFAIIPALFIGLYPQLSALNIMGLHSSQSAVLSAIIYNALIIIALIPPFIFIKLIDVLLVWAGLV